jgi:hypothetical protein
VSTSVEIREYIVTDVSENLEAVTKPTRRTGRYYVRHVMSDSPEQRRVRAWEKWRKVKQMHGLMLHTRSLRESAGLSSAPYLNEWREECE